MDYSSTYRLAQDIRDSDEYKTYHELKESVMSDETTAALVREYRKLQMTIQMTAMSGKTADNEDMQRFSGISTLLFSKPEVSRFLLSEMQLQQALSDIFKIVTEAADLDITMPGIEADRACAGDRHRNDRMGKTVRQFSCACGPGGPAGIYV